MQIKDLKELKKFLQLCREQGCTDVKADGMEFHLGAIVPKIPRPSRVAKTTLDPLAEAKITVPQFTPGQKPDETPEQAREKYNKRKSKQKNAVQQEVDQAVETPDDLTEDELLFWSAGDQPAADPQ